MSIVVTGLNHRTSSVELRERFAFAPARIPEVLRQLRAAGLADEGVILSTCNRVELYAVTSVAPDQVAGKLIQFLSAAQAQPPLASQEFYTLHEPQSVCHLFKVACGLDSMVLGETEVFGQLKKAYDLALQSGCTGARLNKVFQRAFHVAKHIRTATNIQRGSISVASAAVELAEKIFNHLRAHEVLVIGAGDTSEKTARALVSRGAKGIVVAGRSFDRASALATELGGRAVRFDAWMEEFEHVDIAISSTSAPHFILDRARLEPLMKRRRHRPLLLIDIAVPRDIDPLVDQMDNVYLYNVDDLQHIANDYLEQRKEEVIRCEAIIREKVGALLNTPAGPQGQQTSAPELRYST